MSNRVDGQKGFRTEDLRWVPVWTSIGAFVLGSFLAVLVVLGVNVFVNVLLVLAAAAGSVALFVKPEEPEPEPLPETTEIQPPSEEEQIRDALVLDDPDVLNQPMEYPLEEIFGMELPDAGAQPSVN